MKALELEAKLAQLIRQYGDCDVVIDDADTRIYDDETGWLFAM